MVESHHTPATRWAVVFVLNIISIFCSLKEKSTSCIVSFFLHNGSESGMDIVEAQRRLSMTLSKSYFE